MTEFYRAQVVMPMSSGIAADVVTNTLYFKSLLEPTEDAIDDIHAMIQEGYAAIDQLLANDFNRAGAYVKYYDLELAEPNYPIDQRALSLAAATTATDLPAEVTLCVSFQAPRVSGTPQSRRRGRVYLGPFNHPVSQDMSRPWAGLVTSCVAFGSAILNHTNNTFAQWCVFSPTTAGGWFLPGQEGPPNVSAAMVEVSDGWVDNAWDTQRRRGLAPSSRTTFALP